MKLKSVLFVSIFLVLFIFAFPYLLIFLNNRFRLPRFWCSGCQTLGQLLVLGGIVVIADCLRLIKRIGRGTSVPTEPPKSLVTQGFFQFTRNPMYLALFAIILAEFLYLGFFLLFLYFLIFVFCFHLYVVRQEEPELEKRFGKEYLEYKKKVPRWLLKKSIPEILASLRKSLLRKK